MPIPLRSIGCLPVVASLLPPGTALMAPSLRSTYSGAFASLNPVFFDFPEGLGAPTSMEGRFVLLTPGYKVGVKSSMMPLRALPAPGPSDNYRAGLSRKEITWMGLK